MSHKWLVFFTRQLGKQNCFLAPIKLSIIEENIKKLQCVVMTFGSTWMAPKENYTSNLFIRHIVKAAGTEHLSGLRALAFFDSLSQSFNWL